MTSKPITSFTVGRGIAAPWAGDALVEVTASYVPTLLHRLEVYKLEFPYDDPDAWGDGIDLANRQQEALLMDATDRIVSEVRALRDGELTPLEDRDPQLDPFTLSLSSLRTVAFEVSEQGAALSAQLDTANQTLADILTAVQAQGGGEDIIERLDVLITLLGALA